MHLTAVIAFPPLHLSSSAEAVKLTEGEGLKKLPLRALHWLWARRGMMLILHQMEHLSELMKYTSDEWGLQQVAGKEMWATGDPYKHLICRSVIYRCVCVCVCEKDILSHD